jgi:glutamyl-tRNA synthetase/glutamyl-Q tRNA(Asp) synthetase
VSDELIRPRDEGGWELAQAPGVVMGDPVVRRKDGAVAYQLAVVVDDAASAITRVVRGHDIAPSTATQVSLMRALGLREPLYRHHLLLLETHGGKLAKLHGSVGTPTLRGHYGPKELTGFLAYAGGLVATPEPCTPRELLASFDWRRVGREDRVVQWDGTRLALTDSPR